jgi:hypothetical protein
VFDHCYRYKGNAGTGQTRSAGGIDLHTGRRRVREVEVEIERHRQPSYPERNRIEGCNGRGNALAQVTPVLGACVRAVGERGPGEVFDGGAAHGL